VIRGGVGIVARCVDWMIAEASFTPLSVRSHGCSDLLVARPCVPLHKATDWFLWVVEKSGARCRAALQPFARKHRD
jgi:hypothetical protein